MASIQKRQGRNGTTYFVVYRVEGQQKWKKAGARRVDADKVKAKLETELHSGTYQEMPEITVEEFARKWLLAKKADIRPKTFSGYRAHIENRIIPAFKHRKLKSMRTEEIEALKSALTDEGRIHPATVAKCLLITKMMLKSAVIWGYLGRNPAEHVKRPLVPKYEVEFLTPQEISKLLKATPDKYTALIATAAFSGMRQGELLGLKWDDVDFIKQQIFIKRTLQNGTFFDPKSASSRRMIDIPGNLVDILKVHQVRQSVDGPISELNLMFPNEVGKPMDRANLETRIFKPSLKFAGLRPGIKFHSLRHSYASMLIHNGANIKFVQKQLGHANIQITLDTYSHLLPEAGRDAIQKLDDSFSEERVLKYSSLR